MGYSLSMASTTDETAARTRLVLLDEWNIGLSIAPDRGDDDLERLKGLVRARLQACVTELGWLLATHGCVGGISFDA